MLVWPGYLFWARELIQRPPVNPDMTRIRLALLVLALTGLCTAANAALSGLDNYYRLRTTDPVQAENSLSDYVAQNPSDAKARMEFAYLLMKKGRMNEAQAQLEAAVQADP